ncbi:Metal tolerance protein 3 [Vanrija pseudolonga]|uniref:Metal tolerance protein 3 n=1 Tax=Vanrija pseudolonga TaxID=143232 RepID=A0AAF0YD54_9TREE|nr:Metal tolerance protein 3 [Vanrija pseudolonga]
MSDTITVTASALEARGEPTLRPSADIELMTVPSVLGRESGERDPLLLRDKIMSDAELDKLRTRRTKNTKLAAFYEAQNEHIGNLLKPLAVHTTDAEQEEKDMALKVKIAINVSFAANIILAGVQLYAAISSLSLSLFASCIDAVDPFANLLLYLSHRFSSRVDERKWPAHGSRFETSEPMQGPAKLGRPSQAFANDTVGNIVYAFIMGSVNLVLIVMSIQELATHKGGDETKTFHLIPLICVCISWAVKFSLFLYCYAIRKSSSQVQVLWEDHRNDIFVNGFSILTNAGGAKLRWFIDPIGATIIALVIMGVWTRTAYEQFTHLAGITAPTEYVNMVTYKAMTFSEDIKNVDTVRVYHSGPDYVVEVDIVLDPEMPLWKAHDIAQDLQDQIEALPNVDRCFVHVDHEVSHKPEHRKTK